MVSDFLSSSAKLQRSRIFSMISSFENGLEFSEFPTDNFMKKANKTIHEIQRALT